MQNKAHNDPNAAKAAALHHQAAQTFHRAGQLTQAEAHYRAALQAGPDHPDILHALGLICMQDRRFEEAERLLRRAVVMAPDDAVARTNLGVALLRLERREDAVAAFRSAAEIKPDYAVAHFNMAMALGELGRTEEAVAAFRAAVAAQPHYAVAYFNMGMMLRKLGRHGEAVDAFDRAIALKPDHGQARLNRGLSLMELWQFEKAVADFEAVRKDNPADMSLLFSLCNALIEINRMEEALALYEQALKSEPDSPALLNNYGLTLAMLARHEDAIVQFEKAMTLAPGMSISAVNLGNSLNSLGRSDEALALYERVLAGEPGSLSGVIGAGYSKMLLGRIDEARSDFERGLKIDPRSVDCHRYLAEVKTFAEGDPQIPLIEDLSQDMTGISKGQQAIMHFVRFKVKADLKQYDDAFAELSEGNRLWRPISGYNEDKELGVLREMARVFTADLMRDKSGLGNPSALPVFIIGMPRSGTTLIEQILASHPAVFGGDELTDFGMGVVGSYDPEPLPFDVAALSAEDLRRLGGIYVDRVRPKAPDARRITDKRPENFRFAGLIHMVLPNARIIHVRRDPRDTCVSCFSLFPPATFRFTYDLAELGRYYRAYEALMAHWRAVLPPEVMLEVKYEDVVGNLEEQARRLVEFCGLDWDPRCLDFHKTDRSVRTASLAQVRRPLYASSVGRWRRYEAHLKPLFDALGASTLERL